MLSDVTVYMCKKKKRFRDRSSVRNLQNISIKKPENLDPWKTQRLIVLAVLMGIPRIRSGLKWLRCGVLVLWVHEEGERNIMAIVLQMI